MTTDLLPVHTLRTAQLHEIEYDELRAMLDEGYERWWEQCQG